MLKRSFKFIREREAEPEDAVICGFCFKYDEIADINTWFSSHKERMSKNLIVNVDPDCYLLRGHDSNSLLGKVNKNLFFEDRKEGLFFKVSSFPDTQLAKDTKALIDSEILSGLSIGFFEEKSREEKDVKVLESIRLVELSFVTWPAFDSGRVSERATINYLKKKPYEKVKKENQKPPELIC